MPIYEYFCEACQDKFELLRPFSQADVPAVCPRCQSKSEHRLLSRFACASSEGGESHALAGSGGCSGCAGKSCAGCRQ
mgnify:CR=1 FL=1